MKLSPNIEIILGDCIEILPTLENINCVITDPPYGTTCCKWDSVIPFDKMWKALDKCCVTNAAICMTASQPFSSSLVMSNIQMFKHEWIWIKNRGSNFANTVREPMKEHETVLVFSKGKWTYNKQMQPRTGGGLERAKYKIKFNNQPREGTRKFEGRDAHYQEELRVPSSWQKFNVEVGLHPTQKPIALMEYLIETYSNLNDKILDFCMGSGTTGVACVKLGRQFIGVEKDEKHFETAKKRILKEIQNEEKAINQQNNLFSS